MTNKSKCCGAKLVEQEYWRGTVNTGKHWMQCTKCGQLFEVVRDTDDPSKSIEELKQEFEKTRLCREGGSCFECCDYEGIVDDMWNWIVTNFEPRK